MISVHPEGERVVLFDGADRAASADGQPHRAVAADGRRDGGVLGDLRTKQAFGDFKLHAEKWLPELPPDVTGKNQTNSSIYLQDR
ncbi:DUF1080 domain-containing protein [Streptomyces thinghirensis]|nr:DUF1080 domain-containing protein [Streptomyces thinghirensis]